mgnify:CR=1 FL=1
MFDDTTIKQKWDKFYRVCVSEFVPGDKQPSVDSRARKMETITMKLHTKAFILIATIYVFAYAVKGIV